MRLAHTRCGLSRVVLSSAARTSPPHSWSSPQLFGGGSSGAGILRAVLRRGMSSASPSSEPRLRSINHSKVFRQRPLWYRGWCWLVGVARDAIVSAKCRCQVNCNPLKCLFHNFHDACSVDSLSYRRGKWHMYIPRPS